MGHYGQLSKSCWIKSSYTLLGSCRMITIFSIKQLLCIEYNNSPGCWFCSRSPGWFFQSEPYLAELSWVHPCICGHLAGHLGLDDLWRLGLEIMGTMSLHSQPFSSWPYSMVAKGFRIHRRANLGALECFNCLQLLHELWSIGQSKSHG